MNVYICEWVHDFVCVFVCVSSRLCGGMTDFVCVFVSV